METGQGSEDYGPDCRALVCFSPYYALPPIAVSLEAAFMYPLNLRRVRTLLYRGKARLCSGLQHLVTLLSSLETLNSLPVHLLLHLLEPIAFFFRRALRSNGIDALLSHNVISWALLAEAQNIYLSHCFLFILEFLFFGFDSRECLPLRCSLLP